MTIKKIMIVDDSDADHYLTEIVVQDYDEDLTVVKAFDGEEALEMLPTMDEPPCLILLDINMPRMGGFEFLENYKDLDTKPSVVVMLSSSDQDHDKSKALEFDEVSEYIVKPLDLADLEGIIKRLKEARQ